MSRPRPSSRRRGKKRGLKTPEERRTAPSRLTLEEQLRFIDAAYARDGQSGLRLFLSNYLWPLLSGFTSLYFLRRSKKGPLGIQYSGIISTPRIKTPTIFQFSLCGREDGRGLQWKKRISGWHCWKSAEPMKKKQRNWNGYLVWRHSGHLRKFLPNVDDKMFQKLLDSWTLRHRDQEKLVEQFVNEYRESHDEPEPTLSEPVTFRSQSFMDFSTEKPFQKHMDFSGRVLIGANFAGTTFKQGATFSKAVFLGYTNFEGAEFTGPTRQLFDGYWFGRSSFHYIANFKLVKFRSQTTFDRTTFHSDAVFQQARFEPPEGDTVPSGAMINLDEVQFNKVADFKNAVFGYNTDFSHTEFRGKAEFNNTKFHNAITFKDVKFLNTTSFRNTSFDKPPKFFNAELHKDTNFGLIDWNSAEQSYQHIWWLGQPSMVLKEISDDAARAWDELALIMSQRERHTDQHTFFRLKMRARRYSAGPRLTSFLNWLYEISADYGWGVSWALFWWVVHMAGGSLILAVAAFTCLSDLQLNGWRTFWNGMLVSFANAHAILGLASKGGYLHGARKELMNACQEADNVFLAFGTIQAVLGPHPAVLSFADPAQPLPPWIIVSCMVEQFRVGPGYAKRCHDVQPASCRQLGVDSGTG